MGGGALAQDRSGRGPDLIRAFVAVALPSSQRQELGAYLAAQASLHRDYRWVSEESLHLTLRFLGGITPEQGGQLESTLGSIRIPPFQARLGPAGTFGRGRRVRVIWLGLDEGEESMGRLASLIESACRAVGFPAESRPFQPHLTLARSRDERGSAAVELADLPAFKPWEACEFALYRSQLSPKGAHYSILRSFALR